ncbi:hypothetical protein [Nonomuraea sp. B5E05]|uniref:hypothetical protein n=1 Tax=Nonomuraea sp. B5E05 TaxID=3153569 RepID=UPI00325FF58D
MLVAAAANLAIALAKLVAGLVGGGFSIAKGLHEIGHGEDLSNLTPAHIVLAASFVFEGISFARGLSSARPRPSGPLS